MVVVSRSRFVDSIVSEALSSVNSQTIPGVYDFLGRNIRMRGKSPLKKQGKRKETELVDEEIGGETLLTVSLYHQPDNPGDVQFFERATDIDLPGALPGPRQLSNRPFIFTAVREPFPRESSHRRHRTVQRREVTKDVSRRQPNPSWLKQFGLEWDPKSEYSDSFRRDSDQPAPVKTPIIEEDNVSPVQTVPAAPRPIAQPVGPQCRESAIVTPYQRDYLTYNYFGKRPLSRRIKC
uniref:Uncharacterized protein n=1 Tax=Spongospora subterranea TaxID=70186 RepID=A0A0H5QYE2_9EUKA|eukprot:CRZ06676.1 hypothetical protein [Spongospora subterranea]